MVFLSLHVVFLPSICIHPFIMYSFIHGVFILSWCIHPFMLYSSSYGVFIHSWCIHPFMLYSSCYGVYISFWCDFVKMVKKPPPPLSFVFLPTVSRESIISPGVYLSIYLYVCLCNVERTE